MVDSLDLLTRRLNKGAEYIVKSNARLSDVIGNVMHECLEQAKELGYEFPEVNEVAYVLMQQHMEVYIKSGLETLHHACEWLKNDQLSTK